MYIYCIHMQVYVHVLYMLASICSSVGRALGLESRVSWVRVPPEVELIFLWKKYSSGVVELCCVAGIYWKVSQSLLFMCVYTVF